MKQDPYIIGDCLIALRSALRKHETEGLFLSVKDIQELNEYLRRLASYNRMIAHELLRCRWQIKSGCADLSSTVVPFRHFQNNKEKTYDE
ncbi:hypothetical protein [Bartonella sp. CB60]|uniref:hypothetical protein n=1 Tax=Bartonella sp. CB60 TaxID=3113619 RepID=UPI00300E5658